MKHHIDEEHELVRQGYEARTGADRMAMGLPSMPDPNRGDMDKVAELRERIRELETGLRDIRGLAAMQDVHDPSELHAAFYDIDQCASIALGEQS